jgi:tRNA U54 and U55 pseudouridine synthase Pus10
MPSPLPKRTREEIEKILRENLERKYEAYIKTPGEAERAAMMEALRLFNDLVIYDKTPEGM